MKKKAKFERVKGKKIGRKVLSPLVFLSLKNPKIFLSAFEKSVKKIKNDKKSKKDDKLGYRQTRKNVI